MKKILIVEDNAEMNRLYERIFRLNGYEVETNHDGKSALERLLKLENLPSVIILDINMPQMNGANFLMHIKKNETLKEIPIVVLTNSFTKNDSDYFLSLGADLYLVKIEQDFTEIAEKINKLVESRGFNNKI